MTASAFRKDLLDWYAKMNELYQQLSNAEREELHAWEQKNLDGSTVATSDWPGWEKYIGKRPLLNLREVEFVEYLAELINAHPDFSNVREGVVLKGGDGERRLRVDITCEYKGETLIIECATAAPLTIRRIHEYVGRILIYQGYIPSAQLVLAIPTELQPKYKELFNNTNTTVWDAPFLVHKFEGQLEQIRDTPLHEILSRSRLSRITPPLAQQLISQLRNTPKGKSAWSQYQKLCVDIFEYLFVPPLSKPLYEISDATKVNRRDIIIPNYAENGYWKFLRDKYAAEYVVIDTKNYAQGVKKDEVLQVANYLKPFGSGLFGIVCSRGISHQSAIITQREQWIAYGKLIVFLEDDDLVQMLLLKGRGDEPLDVIKQKIEDFRLSL